MATGSFQRTEPEYDGRYVLSGRRRLALGLAAAVLALGGFASTGFAEGGKRNMIRQADITLQVRIFSTPAIWRGAGGVAWAVALVTGEEDAKQQRITAVDALLPNGKRLPGFPVLRASPYAVAPASQLVASDVDGDGIVELVAVNLEGRPAVFRANGVAVGKAETNPVHGVLAWPPLPVRLGDAGPAPSLLLLARDAQPLSSSRHALNLIDITGRSHAGYPVILAAAAELHRPILHPTLRRVFVLLESGQVEAFELETGARPKGFPTAPVPSDVEPGVRHMTLLPESNTLLVTNGAGSLMRIDAASGVATPMAVEGAQRLTGMDSVGERVYAMDEVTGKLLALDPGGRVVSALALNLPPATRVYALQAVATGKAENACVFVVASPPRDPDARVLPLYEQQSTPAERQKLNEIAERTAIRRFGTATLDPAQRTEMDRNVTQMQRSFLENKLGASRLAALLAEEPQTLVRAVLDTGGALQLALEDRISGHTPETGFLPSPAVFPALIAEVEGRSFTLVVPVNAAQRGADGRDPTRSLLRFYHLQIAD